ncbi:MAG: hypothetical protein ILP12_01455 [Lachnospiraceae bacterium]|nr:hypothetical protein [Lachnospiraceae bacterium]
MSETISYKCPGCGAPLVYDTDISLLRCHYCGNTYDLEAIAKAESNETEGYDWGEYNENVAEETLEGTVSYVCRSCGAEIVTDAVTAATHCPYCDNVVVVESNLTGFIKPNCIIPFKIKPDQLKARIDEHCKNKPLLPKDFFSEHKLESVQGMYVPFWLFDCHSLGRMVFRATTVRSWSDSKYDYTETKIYNVDTSGKMDFNKIPVDGSIRMDNALMDSIEPFDYSELMEFQPGYLSGYLAHRFDENTDVCLPRADLRVRTSLANSLRDSVSGYSTVSPISSTIRLDDTAVHYALLPVYLIKSKYGGKEYTFAVNGQTGKLVGDLPVSKGRRLAWLGGLTAAIGLGISLLMFFL